MKTFKEFLIEGGKYSLNCGKVPLDKARGYAISVLGSEEELDKTLPNFNENYMVLQKKIKKHAYNLPREHMPVIEPEDMDEFHKRLNQGRIDIVAPFFKNKLPKFQPKNWKPMEKKEGEEWIEVGVKDGDPNDDVIKAKWGKIAARKLLPTQDQIWLEKLITNIKKFGVPRQGSPITEQTVIVSSEGYILDGHHRFGQAMLGNPDLQLNALFIPIDIEELLKLSRTYAAAIQRRPKK